tara:strand:+ start:8700 stop:9008 length:309 start_codon:yes stop_codon:yes gene_type:complete
MSNLTPEEIAEKARFNKLSPAQKGLETKAKKAALKAEVKIPEVKDGFLNPFTTGVTYADFVDSIPKGKEVAEHLKGRKLSDEAIEWISEEVKNFKKNNKKQN